MWNAVVQSKTSVDFSFLETFMRNTLPSEYSVDEKRVLVSRFVVVFKEGSLSEEQLELILDVSMATST